MLEQASPMSRQETKENFVSGLQSAEYTGTSCCRSLERGRFSIIVVGWTIVYGRPDSMRCSST